MANLLEGRYEIGAPLGSGGMADVVEAHDRRLDRRVAVKLLRAGVPDARARERFEHEARTAAKFVHPNAVTVYDVGDDGQRPFIVMELVEGRTLAQVLEERGPLDAAETVAILDQVLAALGAAHEQGLVHRDVKPGNVLVTANGTVKLADFGIAKAADAVARDLTATGQVMGTPKYLSPEQAAGRPASPGSDVYAAGVMAYEMLAGAPPFQADSPLALALAHQQEPVPPLALRRPGLPPGLVAVVDRALDKDPRRRFPDAGAMRAALTGAPVPPTVDVTADATEVLPPARPHPRPGNRRAALIGAALLVAAVVAAAAWIALGRDDGGEPAPAATPSTAVPESDSEPAATAAPTQPPTTAEADPQSMGELIARLRADPIRYGEKSEDLAEDLEKLAERPDRAPKLIGDISEWVADGELDSHIGNVAIELVQASTGATGSDGVEGGKEKQDKQDEEDDD